MKYPVRYLFGALLIAGVFSWNAPRAVCAEDAAVRAEREDRTKQALESLRRAYIARDTEGFFRYVSQDPAFNWANFKSQVSAHLAESDPVELFVAVDDVLPGEGGALVKIHWQKRTVQKSSGAVQTSRGEAQLVFKTGDKIELFDVQGDTPF